MSYGSAGLSVAAQSFLSVAGTGQVGLTACRGAAPGKGTLGEGFAAVLGRALQENGMVTGDDPSSAGTLPAGLLKQVLEDLKEFHVSGDTSAASSLLAHFMAFLRAVAKDIGAEPGQLLSAEDGQANLASLLKTLIHEVDKMVPTAQAPVAPESTTTVASDASAEAAPLLEAAAQDAAVTELASAVARTQEQTSAAVAKDTAKEATKASTGVHVLAEVLSALSAIAAKTLADPAGVTPETSAKDQGASDDGSRKTTVTVTTTETIIENECAWIPVVPLNPSIPADQNAQTELLGTLRPVAAQHDGRAEAAVRADVQALFREVLSAAGIPDRLPGTVRQGLQLPKDGPSLQGLIAHLSNAADMSVGEESTTEGMFTVDPVSGPTGRFLFDFEIEAKVVEITRPEPGPHYGSEAKGENLFGRTDSSGFVSTGVRAGEAAPSSAFGSIVAERIAKIIEQTPAREMQTDTVMRLKVEGAESFLVSIKEQGGRVLVDIRCAESGMASLLRSQKDEIIRHLEEKQVQSTISITSIDDQDLSRRERREQKREQWAGRDQQSRQFVQMIV